MVAHLLPGRLRGNGFGVLGLVQALGDLASSAVVSLLWATASPEARFAYAAFWMLAALAAALSAGRPSGAAESRPDARRTPASEE